MRQEKPCCSDKTTRLKTTNIDWRKREEQKQNRMKLEREEMPVTPDLRIVNKIVILMTQSHNIEAIEQTCRNDFKIPESEIPAVIEAARAEFVKAADYYVTEEYGKALLSLRELFTSSVELIKHTENPASAIKTALDVLKEIIGLQRLREKEDESKGVDSEELERIREMVTPFLPAPEIDRIKTNVIPVDEIVRILLLHFAGKKLNETGTPRPTPRGHGGKKLPSVAGTPRNLPASADQRPGQKKRSVK
jgi:hypothetical protein